MEYAQLNAKEKQRFQRAVEATKSAQGFMFAPAKDFTKLSEYGLVEADLNNKDGSGNVAIRASQAGLASWNASQGGGGQATQAPAGAVAKAKRERVEIDTGVPIPQGAALRSARESIYPFDTLEIGQSFHVAKTEAMPDPAKAMGSSISSAKRKFGTPLPGQHKTRKGMADNYRLTRNFKMYRVTAEDPKGEGVRIFRLDLPANPNVDGTKGAAQG